jgi:glyceraldehyde 3-phosphate dehydrogenase
MTVRVGINGFGRIGRTYLRAALDRAEAGTQDVHVVAINDIAPPATPAHLLEYDSTFGGIGREVVHDDGSSGRSRNMAA